GQGAGYTGNAGKAQVKGVEYDADLKLGKFTVSTSGAFNDGKSKGNFCNFVADRAALSIVQLSSCPTGSTVTVNGTATSAVAAADSTRSSRQPKFKGTTSIRYENTLGEHEFYLQGAMSYQSSATQDLNVSQNNYSTCATVPDAEAKTAAGQSCISTAQMIPPRLRSRGDFSWARDIGQAARRAGQAGNSAPDNSSARNRSARLLSGGKPAPARAAKPLACAVAKSPLERLIKPLIPFVGVVIVCSMVITYWPGLSLGLRDLVYSK
ncbi:hypothetical protein OY671_008030, partial [Metschnikowia pulcherrima]